MYKRKSLIACRKYNLKGRGKLKMENLRACSVASLSFLVGGLSKPWVTLALTLFKLLINLTFSKFRFATQTLIIFRCNVAHVMTLEGLKVSVTARNLL